MRLEVLGACLGPVSGGACRCSFPASGCASDDANASVCAKYERARSADSLFHGVDNTGSRQTSTTATHLTTVCHGPQKIILGLLLRLLQQRCLLLQPPLLSRPLRLCPVKGNTLDALVQGKHVLQGQHLFATLRV